jgi:hypothetical protein
MNIFNKIQISVGIRITTTRIMKKHMRAEINYA